jgi:DNA-binding CsgD family transcriptional regulator/tetratricopeptide (TPR) repeat protein
MTVASRVAAGSTLVERGEALADLEAHLAAARAGDGRLVVIRGEAGIGKTALVTSLAASPAVDVPVLLGRCDGVSTPTPYGPFRDVMDQLGPALRDLIEGDAPRHRVKVSLLEQLASAGPHLLIIEDVQWADEATIEVLTFVARRLAGTSSLLLVTYRDDDEPHPRIRLFLGQISSMASVHHIVLDPLTRDGVAALIPDSSTDPVQLHALTGGNPFYVVEVLATGVEGVPTTIGDALRARLAQLSASGRAALEAAAVIGSRCEPWLLAAVAGEDVLGADECLQRGLLTKGEVISFRHELTRLAVLEATPAFRAIGLHRRALDALQRAGEGESARLAYHAEGAADANAVLLHALAAGDQAMRAGAHTEAAAQFERAARFMTGAQPLLQADILERIARADFLVNRIPEAHAAWERALALRRSLGDEYRVGTTLRHLARSALALARGQEAAEALSEALRLLAPFGETRELAMAIALQGGIAISNQEVQKGRALSHRALAMGHRLDDPEVVVYATNTLGAASILEGDAAVGEPLLLESLRMALHEGLHEAAHRALYNLSMGMITVRQLEKADRYLTELVDYTSGVEVERCNLDAVRSEVQLRLGDWQAAEELARVGLASSRLDSDDEGSAKLTLARLLIRRGGDGAAELIDEAEAVLVGYENPSMMWPVVVTRAEEAWITGDLGDMRAQLRHWLEWAMGAGDRWAAGEIGRWLWLAGDLEVMPPIAAEPFRLLVEGRHQAAAAAFDATSQPYEAALALAASADPDELREAHRRLVELGAPRVARKVGQRLGELGAPVPRGPRPSTRANGRLLTRREAEIASLLAEGLTNGDIARRLVISEKTVGHHVSSVLGKLGARRRSEVASVLAGGPWHQDGESPRPI